MIFYDAYSDVPSEAIEAFIEAQEMGRLVTVDAAGRPHLGLYPFVYRGTSVEIHLNRADEQLTDLAANPRCVFALDEILGTIPSHWIDSEDAVMATAFHRSVLFECEADVSLDAEVLAEQQTRLMARYQPEGGFRVVTPDEALYAQALSTIAAVRLSIRDTRVKFKIGQNRPVETRAKVASRLHQRGRPNDARAAEALEWTIDRERKRRFSEPHDR